MREAQIWKEQNDMAPAIAEDESEIADDRPMEHKLFWIYIIGLLLFFLPIYWSIFHHWKMFTKIYARRHRITGGLLLLWLSIGGMEMARYPHRFIPLLCYDIILGLLGTCTAVTAAYDFQKAHHHIKNIGSGTLEKEATVTFSEMIEHSFYQGLNLAQILFIHLLSYYRTMSLLLRVLLVLLVTSPWLVRHHFPVNRFSDNYNKGQDVTSLISLMYRTKKYQYIFYKHFLLHGLNISLAVYNQAIAEDTNFRVYWLCLNISYVMEFFLQTLVKKGYMEQDLMMWLQFLLMGVSTIAAVQVLHSVNFLIALTSLFLNFSRRGNELINCMNCLSIGILLSIYF